MTEDVLKNGTGDSDEMFKVIEPGLRASSDHCKGSTVGSAQARGLASDRICRRRIRGPLNGEIADGETCLDDDVVGWMVEDVFVYAEGLA